MSDFRTTIIIHKPVEEVFSYMVDLDNINEIMPLVVKREKLSEGPLAPGTKLKETRRVRASEITSEIEVLTYEENKTFATRSNSNGLIAEYHYRFDEVDEGTQVDLEANIKTTGFKMKLLRKFLVNMVHREDGYQLTNLKEMLEGTKEEVTEEEAKDGAQQEIDEAEEKQTK